MATAVMSLKPPLNSFAPCGSKLLRSCPRRVADEGVYVLVGAEEGTSDSVALGAGSARLRGMSGVMNGTWLVLEDGILLVRSQGWWFRQSSSSSSGYETALRSTRIARPGSTRRELPADTVPILKVSPSTRFMSEENEPVYKVDKACMNCKHIC
jgi:hypothetical protein